MADIRSVISEPLHRRDRTLVAAVGQSVVAMIVHLGREFPVSFVQSSVGERSGHIRVPRVPVCLDGPELKSLKVRLNLV